MSVCERFGRVCVAAGVTSVLALSLGCVTNPVSGQKQFNFMGSSQVVAAAREAIPGQFAADYGVVADAQLNAYVDRVGRSLVAKLTPADMVYRDMTFSFQVVNAVYINAYAFPDGTIAITRGMLVEMEDEAQLAAVLGHEIAHVNCGHTASAMSAGTVLDTVVSGTSRYLASSGSQWADLVGAAGQLGGAAYLARYSRSQEREADQGGMLYLVRAGYDPQGMVGLMNLLVRLSGSSPSALEQMFSSHPMSAERLQAAQARVSGEYAGRNAGVNHRAAYLAATAGLRKNAAALKQFAAAEGQLAQGQYAAARVAAEQGLRQMPDDYAGLLILAQAKQKLGDAEGARLAAERAARVQPGAGARAQGLLAQSALQRKDYAAALTHLAAFERQVPGDAGTALCQGLVYEAQGQKQMAAQAYRRSASRGGTGSAAARQAQQRLQRLTP